MSWRRTLRRCPAGLVESGVGFVPWLLETMDHGYRAHHMFVRPVIPEVPSHYLREHCFATFQEDEVGVDAVEHYDLSRNFLWANDHPHHEGSWGSICARGCFDQWGSGVGKHRGGSRVAWA
jgi:hypothetical protein